MTAPHIVDPARVLSEALIDLKSATRAGEILLEGRGKIADAHMEEEQVLRLEI